MIALELTATDLAPYLMGGGLLVNATAVGWREGETPLPNPPVDAQSLVYDMVYRQTLLLRESAAQGAAVRDGLGMLLYQGALALQRWAHQPAPVEVMRTALLGSMR
jgi:shikimate dehydrogenase